MSEPPRGRGSGDVRSAETLLVVDRRSGPLARGPLGTPQVCPPRDRRPAACSATGGHGAGRPHPGRDACRKSDREVRAVLARPSAFARPRSIHLALPDALRRA